jgi:carbon storage regulator
LGGFSTAKGLFGGISVAYKAPQLRERILTMLVLSRRQSETIVIGDNIRVQVLEISGGRVRLAIEAPGNVSVDREEIWQRKQLERLQEHRLVSNRASDRLLAGVH